MQYLGGKLSAAQLQVTGWVGNLRRSFQGAVELVWGPSDEKQEEEGNEDQDEGGNEGGTFQRAMSPLRSFARRSRRSLRRFSARSRQHFQRRSSGTCSTQVNSYFISDEEKLTDALSEEESHQQDDVCEKTSETESPQPIPDVPFNDVDATDSHKDTDFTAFPEISTRLLDTSSQRSKAQLSRRRNRSRPSRSFRTGAGQTDEPSWSVYHPTAEKEAQKESDSEEDQPKPKIAVSPIPPTQKVSVFPGMSPASLLAGLKKKKGGGPVAEEEKKKDKKAEEKESPNEEVAPSPSQLSQSPRLSALAGATRVLPPIGSKDGGASSSPAWLKELKSKKRMSQHGGKT